MISIRTQHGFTLIELLLVIAIIGLLASVALASLFGPRERAREARALATARSAQVVAVVCMDDHSDLFVPGTSAPATDYVCDATSRIWPDLGLEWEYGDAGSCVFEGDSDDHEFLFCVQNTAGTRVIGCTNAGCTISDVS